jgi:hypothetical protein
MHQEPEGQIIGSIALLSFWSFKAEVTTPTQNPFHSVTVHNIQPCQQHTAIPARFPAAILYTRNTRPQ